MAERKGESKDTKQAPPRIEPGRPLDPASGGEYTLRELQAVYGDALGGAAHLAGLPSDVRLTRDEAEALLDQYHQHTVGED